LKHRHIILHQADLLAARVEWEAECLDNFYKEPVKKPLVNNFPNKQKAQEKAIRQIGSKNSAFADMLKNL
jgi:hypothetical protein